MQYAILAILIVAVIAFFVMVWKASPQWRWYSLLTASMTMLLAVTFLFPTSAVLRSRSAWHKVKEDLEVRLRSALEERERLNFGDPDDPTAGKGAVILGQELSKLAAETGRRWRNLRMTGTDGAAIKLVKPQPPADEFAEEEADAVVIDALVPESLIVYGFAEKRRGEGEVPLPDFYLGEFRVTASDANSVTLEPTSPLPRNQAQAIGGQQAASWSLYELLPLDGHHPFVALGSRPDDENLFGRIDDELVKRLMANRVPEEVLNAYLRDGTRFAQDDSPADRWDKIEFTKKYTFNVDSPSQSGVLQGGFFDGSGRAVDSRLQRSDDGATFEKGEQLALKREAAQALIDEGTAKLIDSYYVRSLNDYRFALRNMQLRIKERNTSQEELKFEESVLYQATNSSKNLLADYQGEAVKLEDDGAQTHKAVESIRAYNKLLQTRLDEEKQTLIRIYRTNLRLEQELQRIYGG
ncbi:MAG: hypothetical protein AAF989_09145 [Planctomycetota bacterium]